jgi:hypothetical protein
VFTDLPVQTTFEPLLWLLSVEAWLELKRVSGVGVATVDPPSDCTTRGFLWGTKQRQPALPLALCCRPARSQERKTQTLHQVSLGLVYGRRHPTFSEVESMCSNVKGYDSIEMDSLYQLCLSALGAFAFLPWV